MKKDYRNWIKIKREQHNKEGAVLFFHEREIWHSYVGENIGFEQDGSGDNFIRPVIIFRKFGKATFWGIPVTHTYKDLPFYFSFQIQSLMEIKEVNSAVLSQIRLMDAKRLIKEKGRISTEDFVLLKEMFKALLP